MQQRWLIYALGSGWGHLNRAIALARQAPCPVEILTNSAQASVVQARLATSQISLHRLPNSIASPPEAQAYVQDWLTNQHLTHLVVDTFPRGLVGELVEILPRLDIPKTLVHRDLTPRYIAAKALLPFIQEHYDQVLIPGERQAPLAHLEYAHLNYARVSHIHQTAPWLMRERAELIAIRESLQHLLQLPQHHPIIIICATGSDTELATFGEIHHQLIQHYPTATVRCLAHQRPSTCPAEQWISHWPGLEILQFADIVVGAAGYNLTHECAALGIPLVSLPMDRKYDRQARRAADLSIPITSISACLATVGALLSQLHPHQNKRSNQQSAKQQGVKQPKDMENGVYEAISLITTLGPT